VPRANLGKVKAAAAASLPKSATPVAVNFTKTQETKPGIARTDATKSPRKFTAC
jgi:hypothetical protein